MKMKRIEKLRMYELCIKLARQSPCKKMGFGAVLYDESAEKVLWEAFNTRILDVPDICQPECIRMKIPSRTQSMVGACLHAEEVCLWYALKYADVESLRNCALYVAGVWPDGRPIERGESGFSCIRCATQMVHSGVSGVNVWFERDWHFFKSEHALRDSQLYATQALFPQES
jgi:tRNA(Arg) A34 adenosine deaminase TadA